MVRSVGVRSLSGVASATPDLLLLLRTIRSVATAVKAMLCSERRCVTPWQMGKASAIFDRPTTAASILWSEPLPAAVWAYRTTTRKRDSQNSRSRGAGPNIEAAKVQGRGTEFRALHIDP